MVTLFNDKCRGDARAGYYNFFVMIGNVLLQIPTIVIATILTNRKEGMASIVVFVFVLIGFTIGIVVSIIEIVMMIQEVETDDAA